MSGAGWLRGIVKEVPSGDTVVISGAPKGGPPPEKRLTLSSIIAPKLGKRDGSTRDEPFAWESREFLRKLVVGKQVVFKVDYVVEAIGNREFGSIFLDTTPAQNVAEAVVSCGMAKVRTGSQQSPYIESLKKAEETAQLTSLGVWTKDTGATSAAIRSVPASGFNANSYLAAVGGKGTVVTGIVEAVANGGMLRLTMLPDHQQATVVLCGVQAPSMGRRAVVPTNDAPENGGTPSAATALASAAPSAASIAGTSAAEPFAWEAKHLTEMRVMSREIRLVLEGVDKFDNLFATVYAPAGAAAAEESLAELLIKAGYAKCVEWSLALMSSGAQRLRELERVAKAEKKGMWTNYVAPPTNQTKLSDTFVGKVVEIVSGDCLVIKDVASGVERRVQLSSIRAPRMGARERAAEPWGTDAREFLRKKLIGREVNVKMEYNRKVPVGGDLPGTGGEERILSFGNVELVPDKGEEAQNIAEMMVARGYASVIKHRSDEERSCVYEKLVECEDLAKGAKRGVHSAKEPAANRINDVSLPGNAAKAKQYLPFFQRGGKMLGVVEFVLSGHRLKITIPKEGTTIVFAPSGIKTPSRAMPAGQGKPAVAAEPFCDEAVAFTREHALQRDCELSVETMDRGGTFLGTITILPAGGSASASARPMNLALALMRAGLAKLQPNVDPHRLMGGSELLEAQQAAKEARLKIWQNWTPADDKVEDEDEENGAATNGSGAHRQHEVMEVIVTEVVDANEFYVQRTNEPRVAWLADQLRLAGEAEGPAIPPELKPGQMCIAQFSLDKQWYRAYVEKAMPLASQYEVFFVDFGNRERVSDRCVRIMDAALAAVPPQALMCRLAFLKVPTGSAECAAEARMLLNQLLGGGLALTATVISREKAGAKDKHPRWANGHLSITLTDPATKADLAVELLCAGLARLPKLKRVRDASSRDAVTALAPFEEEAKEARRGLFTYGDPGDSEDEEAAAPKAGAWGKPK